MKCFNCSGEATKRYTLMLAGPKVLKDKVICDECVSVFQQGEWIEVHEAPALMRGGNSRSNESYSPQKAHQVDEVLKTLSDPIRREIIHYFENHTDETTASLEELVTHIERRTPSSTSEALWKTLYQIHLPALQSKGWLEFDTERNIVTYHGHDEAERVLREVHGMFST